MRIEYKLLSGQKVKGVLGHNIIEELLKDEGFKRMQEAFKDMLYKDIIQYIEKDIKRQVDHSIKTIKEYRAIGGGSNAIDEYLKNYQATLIDAEIIMEATRSVVIPNHYARECKRAISSMDKIKGITLFGNINKLNEILEVLGYKKIEMDITPSIKKELKKHY